MPTTRSASISWAVFALRSPGSVTVFIRVTTPHALYQKIYSIRITKKENISEKNRPILPSSLSPMGTPSQSCWSHCSSCPSAAGYQCKAKKQLRGSFHLVHAALTALSFTAAWEFSMKRIFEQKQEISIDTFLYTFFRKVFLKKSLTDSKWIRKSSPWLACIPAVRQSQGPGESRAQHLPQSHLKWLPW